MEVYEQYLSKALSNIIMARQAMSAFKTIGQKDYKNGASYHTQQAIELILKYCIYSNVKYNKNDSHIQQIRIHDLDRLIQQYCIPLGIYVPKKIEKNAMMYSSWEAESRYSLNYSVRADSIENALDEVEQWIIKLKPMYRSKILHVRKKLNV